MIANDIQRKLELAFQPSFLLVTDESDMHIGHAGYRAGQMTHIKIQITSRAFDNIGKINCHKMIYRILQDEIAHGLHAISIECSS